MFKKRSLKGNSRTKVIKRDDESESESDQDTVLISKKQKTTDTSTAPQINKQAISNNQPLKDPSLTKNNSATKVDILNQEIIDKERLRKTQGQDHEDDGLYKGQSNYKQLVPSKSTMDVKGPKRVASNIRSTMVFDFQRDICKDFRDTGFCGYGDSCKFMHSRDDFKAGWKLNTDWKLEENGKDQLDNVKDIPFKCVLCKDDYKKPVVTNCEHYFCEQCYLKRFKKGLGNCFICQKPTNGIVKPARNLNDVMKKIKE